MKEMTEFEKFKNDCVVMVNDCYEEECWYDEENDIERNEPIDCKCAIQIKQCNTFDELAEVMIAWEFWEIEDAIEKAQWFVPQI